MAIAALAMTVAIHPAVFDLVYRQLPDWVNAVASILILIDPILALVLLGVIGPRLWRAGGRSRAVGFGALVAALIVSAWACAIALDKFALRPH